MSVVESGGATTSGTAVSRPHAGHTKGCTTWTMKVEEGGKAYNVVIRAANVNEATSSLGTRRIPGSRPTMKEPSGSEVSLPVDFFLGAQAATSTWARNTRDKEGTRHRHRPRGLQGYVTDRERRSGRNRKAEGGHPMPHFIDSIRDEYIVQGARGSGDRSADDDRSRLPPRTAETRSPPSAGISRET